MNRTVIKTFVVAALLFVSSFAVFAVSWWEKYDPEHASGGFGDWTFVLLNWSEWDYLAGALLVAAIGCTVAAVRLGNH